MHIKRKINWYKYLSLSFLSLTLCVILARTHNEIIGILVVYLATLINQLMMVEGSSELVAANEGGKGAERQKRKKVLITFVLKFVVLLAGFLVASQLMGNRVIIPLINYVIMIFILIFSMRKN